MTTTQKTADELAERIKQLELELQFECNANYYDDFAKVKIENASLLADKEMLDWIEKRGSMCSAVSFSWWNVQKESLREAITTAMNGRK